MCMKRKNSPSGIEKIEYVEVSSIESFRIRKGVAFVILKANSMFKDILYSSNGEFDLEGDEKKISFLFPTPNNDNTRDLQLLQSKKLVVRITAFSAYYYFGSDRFPAILDFYNKDAGQPGEFSGYQVNVKSYSFSIDSSKLNCIVAVEKPPVDPPKPPVDPPKPPVDPPVDPPKPPVDPPVIPPLDPKKVVVFSSRRDGFENIFKGTNTNRNVVKCQGNELIVEAAYPIVLQADPFTVFYKDKNYKGQFTISFKAKAISSSSNEDSLYVGFGLTDYSVSTGQIIRYNEQNYFGFAYDNKMYPFLFAFRNTTRLIRHQIFDLEVTFESD